jgi:hypothetical protein
MKIKLTIITGFLCLFSASLYAETNLYGSIRFATFYMTEKDMGPKDKNYTSWELMNNSRVGGTVENNEIKGGFEFGYGHDGIELRKLFGIYSITDSLKLKIGRDYTPLNFFPSNQVAPIYENEGDSGLKPYGGIYEGFENMIQISTDRFKIALIEPATKKPEDLKFGRDADIEKTAPKLELSFNMGTKTRYIDLYTGYQTYRLIEKNTETEFDINSWVMGINFGFDLGAFYFLGNAYSGQNINPYGLWAEGDDSPRLIGNDIYDCTTDGYILTVGVKLDSAVVETGAGYIVHNLDGAVTDDETLSAYLNLQYQVNNYFQIVPEIGIVDYKTNNAGADEGKKVYAGVKWQMDF